MLEVKHICKSFKDQVVLEDVSFSIDEGEMVAVIGANGSGKTTLFRIIADLLKPDSGEITYCSQTLTLKDIGYLPEERSLFYDCSLSKQLRLLARLSGYKEDEEIVLRWLERMDLLNHENDDICQLSKGNQQKVSLIAAVIKDPSILILDEPFTALDLQNVNLFEAIIQQFHNQQRIILLSSHIYDPINQYCDRYIVLQDGGVVVNLTKQQLKEDERRAIIVEDDIEIDGSIYRYRISGKTRYIYENEELAKKQIRSLMKRKITGFSMDYLTIEDYQYVGISSI